MIQAESVHSTPPKTVSKFNRGAIMARAWSIFRTAYKYPAIKFASIGWKCFGACVRQARAEAKDAARIAAFPATDKATRIQALQDAIAFALLGENWAQARSEISAARAEIALLSAPSAATLHFS